MPKYQDLLGDFLPVCLASLKPQKLPAREKTFMCLYNLKKWVMGLMNKNYYKR